MADRKRVLVPLAPGFEELEAVAPVDLLRRAGAHVVTASVGAPNPIVGRNHLRLMADIDLSEALEEWGDDWDLVVLPGGAQGTENLAACEPLMALLQRRLAAGAPTAAICAAPTVLARAGLDRTAVITSHPAARDVLGTFAAYTEAPIALHGKVLTSRGPGTAVAFGLACVELLYGPDKAAEIRRDIVA